MRIDPQPDLLTSRFSPDGHREQSPTADPAAIVQGARYRFTVLSSRLIRLEWSASGEFVDRATATVTNRRFEVASFELEEDDEQLVLRTEHLLLRYDKGPFSAGGLSISLRQKAQSSHFSTWHYGGPLPHLGGGAGNLGGTARTLDDVDGACELPPGILATYGYAVVDDSSSVELGEDGWITPRPPGGTDLYFFGHGRDFQAALAEFFVLTGPAPLVPRRALGNWWSRFWAYTDLEYLELMDSFAAEGAPFAVAVLDMDWHLVDIDPQLGSGWTGYSWNRKLFPDPPGFLHDLHQRGMLVCLNLHPADGVRRHEDAYPAMIADLGLDPDSGVEIPFDITSPLFVDSYLKRLHHPHEKDGVDFWWLDWQSGGSTRVPGLDPLWMLNHLHFHDSGRDGRRPLTLSRYAGLGSHRYPIGFSGDTITTWDSLDFQPYFTATAANVGYFWWSHDIGGHMLGVKDHELTVRWFQFGAFSPINRLHSSNDPFNSKEPSQFGPEASPILIAFLRLRHRLVPYLYTAAWRSHADGIGIVRPMYHDHPTDPAAFSVPNQYLFGSDLIVAPITTPRDPHTGLAGVTVWLPAGDWFDLFTGKRYRGGRTLRMHRPLELIPVLVRGGAAIPMLDDPEQDIGENPEKLVLRIVPGFRESRVYEDAGSAAPTRSERHETGVNVEWPDGSPADLIIRIDPPSGPGALQVRDLTIDLVGAQSTGQVEIAGVRSQLRGVPVRVDGILAPALRLSLGTQDLSSGLELRLAGVTVPAFDRHHAAFALLHRAEIEYLRKNQALRAVERLSGIELVQELNTIGLPASLSGALIEVCDQANGAQQDA